MLLLLFRERSKSDTSEGYLAEINNNAGVGAAQDPNLAGIDRAAFTLFARVLMGLRGLRILVIEDAPDVLGVLTMLLRIEGADVAAAGSGQEALTVFRSRHFDVVVSDLGLPDISGDGHLREALPVGKRRHIPRRAQPYTRRLTFASVPSSRCTTVLRSSPIGYWTKVQPSSEAQAAGPRSNTPSRTTSPRFTMPAVRRRRKRDRHDGQRDPEVRPAAPRLRPDDRLDQSSRLCLACRRAVPRTAWGAAVPA